MKIRKIFSTPLKASLTIISLVAIVAVITGGSVYVARAIAQSSSIGVENAKNFAFVDAGVDPVDAKAVKAEFEYEQGKFVYEVEFTANGTEYEYWINAADGSVVKKNAEIVTLEETNAEASTQITPEQTSTQITLEQAKEIALKDAQLTANDVTFTTAKLDTEDGVTVYEIEFLAGDVEYEYEINANTGEISSKKIEAEDDLRSSASIKAQTTKAPSKDNASKETASSQITLDDAKKKALDDAGVSASNVTFTKAELDYDDGIAVYEIEFYTSTHEYEYEINASSGKIHDKSIEQLEKKKESKKKESDKTENKDKSGSYIGIDKAKSIAAQHAGLSKSDVSFSKAKLDKDDGKTIYEIEFYKNGTEYEYEIDAVSGKILEYDSEQDDD